MKLNDARAFHRLGDIYWTGNKGLPKNSKKAFELFKQAAKLGSIDGHSSLARAGCTGRAGIQLQ